MANPSALTALANFAGGVPDRLLTRIPDFMLHRSSLARAEYEQRLAFYQRAAWDERGERFLRLPAEPAPRSVETLTTQEFHGATRQLLRFDTAYEARNPALRTAFHAETANQHAYVHLFEHPPDAPADARAERERPLVLAVHGFGMGAPSRAIRMFRVQRLLSMGVDVALFTLPCHWRRNAHYPGPEQMLRPQDVPFTIELLGQAVSDLHQAIGMLRERGHTRIGLIGASLGGYLSGLYASFSSPLSFIFMVVPAIDLSGFLSPRASLFDFPVDEALAAQTRAALQRVAPLHQPPGFDAAKMCVVAHQGDRICPVGPTRQFVEARGIADYTEVVGGHWLYLDREVRGRTWYGWLARHGFIEARSGS